MATRKQIERIGRNEALLACGIALVIDLSFLVCDAIDSGVRFDGAKFGLGLIFALWLVTIGVWLGKKTAIRISETSNYPAALGLVCALATLYLTCVVVGFSYAFWNFAYLEMPFNPESILFCVFYFPMVAICWSAIIIIPHGLWFGWRIGRKLEKLSPHIKNPAS